MRIISALVLTSLALAPLPGRAQQPAVPAAQAEAAAAPGTANPDPAADAAQGGTAAAQPPGEARIPFGAEVDLDAYRWTNRPLVVFADSDRDPRFIRQMEMLADDPKSLIERDVVVLIDTDPRARGPLRKALRPRDFMLVLVDKDGQVMLRKPRPWSVREISHAIDKTPLRQEELEERRRGGS